jgi:peptidoglycan/LPS O-acetylase OafA/YrhL
LSNAKRSDIQTLRAIAVLSVIAFHAFPDLVPGGFVGVDIFFVLSGYLITQSIIGEINKSNFTVADFYRRRIRRIFPALFTMLGTTLVVGWFILDPEQLQKLGRNVVAAALFSSNFDFAITTGYFDGGASTKPLLHTWSLAVEEQFYIFYPLLLVFIFRFRREWLIPCLVLIAVISLALSEFMLSRWPSPAYYLSPPRFYELLIGAVLAARSHPSKLGLLTRSWLTSAGLAAVFIPIFYYTETTRFPGFAALLPCIGTAAIIAAGTENNGWVSRLMSFKPVTAIGDWSYSLYLWHWPLLVYVALAWPNEPPAFVIVITLVVTFILSWLSFRFLEQPAARMPLRSTPFLSIGTSAIMVAVVGGGILMVLGGAPGRFDEGASKQLQVASDINPKRDECHSGERHVLSYTEGCIFGDLDQYPSTVVWGDSHGAELSVAMGEIAKRYGDSIRELTFSACPPTSDVRFPARPSCDEYNDRILEAISADTQVTDVVLAAYFTAYGQDDAVVRGFSDVARKLRAAGKAVTIILPIPTMTFTPPARVAAAMRYNMPTNNIGRTYASYLAENSAIRDELKRLANTIGAKIEDPAQVLCADGFCHAFDPAYGTLYFDNVHLGLAGAVKTLANLKLSGW